MDAHLKHCLTLVEEADRHLYQICLFFPVAYQRMVIPVIAFDIELGRSLDASENLTVNAIRLQWWSDAIDALLEGHVRAHPIIQLFAEQSEFEPHFETLKAMVEARQDLLELDENMDPISVKLYAERTGGALFRLCQTVIESENMEAAFHLGQARTLIACGQAMMQELMHYDVADNNLQDGRAIIKHIVTDAEKMLLECRYVFVSEKREKLPLLLLGRILDREIQQIRSVLDGTHSAVRKITPLNSLFRILLGYVWARP